MPTSDAVVGRRQRRICVCTRVHQNNASRPVDLTKVRQFLDGVLPYADSVAMAVGEMPPPVDEDQGMEYNPTSVQDAVRRVACEAEQSATRDPSRSRAVQDSEYNQGGRDVCQVKIISVTPWGNFTPALNALLAFAARNGDDMILFQSLEAEAPSDAIDELEKHLGDDDLVVGAALAGHAFHAGCTVELTGVTTPWNTLALWDVHKLSKLGFIGVAEGLVPDVPAGVEEVTAIAAMQALVGPDRAGAKLLKMVEVSWETHWEDEGRRQWHEAKMASKVQRAQAQMDALGIRTGSVMHIDLTTKDSDDV